MCLGILDAFSVWFPAVVIRYPSWCSGALLGHVMMLVFTIERGFLGDLKQGDAVCGATVLLLVVLVWTWALVWLLARFNTLWLLGLVSSQRSEIVKIEYDKALETVPDVIKACYESKYFRTKCENALKQVTREFAATITLTEILAAGKQITQDPGFLAGPMVSFFLSLAKKTELGRTEAVSILKHTSAIHFERIGGGVSAAYHYNILQLPSNADVHCAKRQFNAMQTEWGPPHIDASRNLQTLTHSFHVIADHLEFQTIAKRLT